jgi:hypothetical protein
LGSEPVFSQQLEAWLLVEGRDLVIADDRAGTRRWLTEAERHQAEAERSRAEAERSRAEAERERAAAERERAAAERERQLREDVERRLQELLGKRE